MLSEQAVVGIRPNVPGMRGRNIGEEIIGISTKDGRSITRELGVKEDLRRLRHAGDRLDAEVAEGRDGPSI